MQHSMSRIRYMQHVSARNFRYPKQQFFNNLALFSQYLTPYMIDGVAFFSEAPVRKPFLIYGGEDSLEREACHSTG